MYTTHSCTSDTNIYIYIYRFNPVNAIIGIALWAIQNLLNTYIHLEAQFEFGIHEHKCEISFAQNYVQPNSAL